MTTITEDYVSFETAKLLKEKGFNGPCSSHYMVDTGLQRWTQNYGWNTSPLIVLCPTQQMAMKWLREVHKLDIDVSIEYKNSKKVYYYSILKKTVIRNIDCLHSETNFDSYEQAAEAAIKYCLEHLIK